MADTESNTKSNTAASLGHHLKRLPFELQRQIWRYHIPSRVIDAEFFDHRCGTTNGVYRGDASCSMVSPGRATGAPTISQMTQASRSVFSEGAAELVQATKAPSDLPAILRPPAMSENDTVTWFDPRRDIVLFQFYESWRTATERRTWFELMDDKEYYDEEGEVREYDEEKDGDRGEDLPPDHLLWSIHECTRVCVLLTEMYGLDDQFFRYVRRPILVCVDIIAVHMSEALAIESGLFGLCLDQPMTAVHLSDTVGLKRFCRAIHDGYSSLDPGADKKKHPKSVVGWLDRFLDPERNELQVESAVREAKINFVAWQRRLSDDVPDEVIESLKAHSEYCALKEQTEERREEMEMELMEIPWVKETLKKLPKFDMVVIFRYCPGT